MSVETTQNTVSYISSGTVGPYSFTFPITDSADMTVTQTDLSGHETLLSPSTYTVTPVNNDFENGGSVLLDTACPINYTLTLLRATVQTQEDVFTDGMPALYKTFEHALDKLTMEVQDINEKTSNLVGPQGPAGPTGPQGRPGSPLVPNRTRRVFTSGSGAYTTPTGVTYIVVRMIGGGGGGAAGALATGGNGGNTTWGTTISIAGGGIGGATTNGTGGNGGTVTGGDFNFAGTPGGSGGSTNSSPGGYGGSGPFGGGGRNGTPSSAAGAGDAGTGGGGGAGASLAGGSNGGGGGGSGGYLERLIVSPTTAYAYAVGTGGTGPSGDSNQNAGAAGGSGIIIVDEFYNW